MSDFMESIFDSVSIIVDKKLEELAFDTTMICRIVDDSNSKNGKYKVTDGSITFEAYSESSEYKSGESVRVTVPNNDYSQKKFIIGKYVEGEEENNTPITYVSQIDSVVNVSGNLINWDEIEATEIIMNGPKSSVLVWEKDFKEELEYLQNSEVYNTLLLKADFQTFMDNYQIIEGTYGLSIELFIYIPEIDEFIRKTAIFSNAEMFGNTYSFKIPSTQSKVFPLTITEGFIKGIKISLCQGNDFKDQKGQIDYPLDPETGEKIYPQLPHIKINDLQLGFGSNVTGVADNVLQIYSPNSLDYKYYLHTDVTNRKKIELVWYNKNEFDKYLGFSDGYYDPTYDEIEYLKIAKIDNRLVEQQQEENIPSDKCGLWLAADIAELETLINDASTMITSDLHQRLSSLNDKIQEISTHDIPINPNQPMDVNNIRSINTQLQGLIDNIKDKVTPINNQFKEDQELYIKLLECVSQKKAYKTLETVGGEEIEKDIDLDTFTIPDLNRFSAEYINDTGTGILNEVNDILETLQADLSVYFPSYLGIYDQAKIRIDWVISEIKKILNKFPIVNIVSSYPTDDIHKYEDITYQDYLLYYTYKEQGFPPNKPQQILDMLFKKEIEEGETEPNLPDYLQMNLDIYNQKYCIYWYKYNSGYQTSDDYSFLGENWQRLSTIYKIEVDDDPSPIMNPIFNDKGNNVLNEYMDPSMQEQKYKAVLFYDHVMYTSNELIFTNLDEVPNVIAIDKADGLQIEHLENSFDSYFLYSGSSNNLWDISQASKTRQLRCHFDGLKLGDELLYGARIYWYIPESSMLTYNKEWLVNNLGFSTDLDELEETKKLSPYYRPGYVCFSKVIQDKSNTISDKDQEDENDTSLETDFIVDDSFMRDEGTGQYDTRDFWYWIQNSYEPTGKTHIICMVNPKGSEIYYETKLQFSFGLMGTNGTHHTLSVINKGLCPAVRKPSGIADDGSLTLKVELRDVNNEKIDVSLIDSNQNFVSVEKVFQSYVGFPAIYNAAYDGYSSILEDNELKLIPDRNNPSSAIIRVSLKDYEVEEGKKVSLSSIHPIPWSQDHYYLSGTTRIVYNSLGVLDTNAQFDREYHLYKVSDDTEVKVNTGELDEFGNEKTDPLNWRVRLYNSKGEEIVAGNPLYNQYISFAPKIDCQKQWVEVTLNLEDIVQIFNTINLDESKLQLHIDDEQYKQLLLYYEGLQSYFIWDDANEKWKFNGGQPEYELMVNLIQLETVETILNNIETNLGDRPIISANDYNTLISYYKPWEDYFIFKKEQNNYECISSLSTLEAMKKLEESKKNDQVKQILTNIGNSLKANPIISTKDYNTLVHHNVSWSTYFDEIKNYKCFMSSITSSDGTPSTLDIMKDAANAEGNSDVLNILNTITESNSIVDEKSYSTLITFKGGWTTWFDNCWEYTQGHTILNEMKNTVNVINKVVEQEINNTSLLVPSPMYCQGLGSECFIIVEGFYKDSQGNETIYWQQPIIIIQNQHESSLLNQWNGDFVIDEENKYIMSAMLGAGYKNPDNTYNGVLMGDLAITELLDTSNSARSVESRMVGLYGFHEGAQSFGFRVDGTAFIGKAGAGRIEFNGNKGIIQSGNYIASNGKMGMSIDLTNGHIDAYNFKLTSNRIVLNSDINANSYLTVYGDTDQKQTLINIGNKEYYLQSKSYADGTVTNAWTSALNNNGSNNNIVTFLPQQPCPAGAKIDLASGGIYASPGLSFGGLTIDSSAHNTAGTIVLAAGSNFAVDCLGNLKARGNWELWADHDGKVGLRNDGVYARYTVGTATDVEDSVSSKVFKYTQWGETKVGAGQASHWTDWDTIAGASQAFMEMKIWNTINSMASLVGILGALGGAAWLATIELRLDILWTLYLAGGFLGGSGGSSS